MKKLSMVFCSFAFIFIGCGKVQVHDLLLKNPNSQRASAIAILSNAIEDRKLTDCVHQKLKSDLPSLKVFSEDKFRDAIFPWFEPSTTPKDLGELSALLKRTIVTEHLKILEIDYLIFIRGNVIKKGFEGPLVVGGGFGAVGGFGYQSSEHETHIYAKVWDINKQISVGNTEVHSQGKFRMPWFIMPIPIPTDTKGTACEETAELIADFLNRKALDGSR